MSSLLATLAESLTSATPNDDEELPNPREWAERHRRIDDRPFSLERFAPLTQCYEDGHPHQVYMKCAQVGVSEMAISKALHALDVGARYYHTDNAGLNVAYLFPTDAALDNFSKERFSSLQHESEHIATLFAGSPYNDTGFKQAGKSYLYLRGTQSKAKLKSFPADVLVRDEYDEMDDVALAMSEKRLRASTVKRIIDLSTPMFPGTGIHALYLQSDQQVWEVCCVGCAAWDTLDFFRDVRLDGAPYDDWRYWDEDHLRRATITVTCPECGAERDRCDPHGRWRALRPDVNWLRGYHIPALAFPGVDVRDLVLKSVSADPAVVAEFFRSDLGLPYDADGVRVTDTMLKQLSHELDSGQLPAGPWRQTTMGVDVGARFHYRISSTGPDGERYIRKMGAVRSWKDLDDLLKEYKVRRCVIDALPELHAVQEWIAKHPGKVVRAYYHQQDDLFKPEAEKITDTVHINRTMVLDAVYARIATAADRWPAAIHNDAEVQAHLKAPVRAKTKNKDGQEIVAWVHTAPDHLFHACAYDLIAQQTLPKAALGAGVLAQGAVKGW